MDHELKMKVFQIGQAIQGIALLVGEGEKAEGICKRLKVIEDGVTFLMVRLKEQDNTQDS